jgi:hypothetical protein
MNKGKMTLQQFADQYGLKVRNGVIHGPGGEILHKFNGWFYWRRSRGFQRFLPSIQAQEAIEAIGLPYNGPSRSRAFLIEEKTDGCYVIDKAGPFETREVAETAMVEMKEEIDLVQSISPRDFV